MGNRRIEANHPNLEIGAYADRGSVGRRTSLKRMVKIVSSCVLIPVGGSAFGINWRQNTYPLAFDRNERIKRAWYVPRRLVAHCGLAWERHVSAHRGWVGGERNILTILT